MVNTFDIKEGRVAEHSLLSPALGAVLLKENLFKGVAVFSFIKSDGSIRHAVGTVNPKLIPTDPTEIGAMRGLLQDVRDAHLKFNGSPESQEKWDKAITAVTDYMAPKEPKSKRKPIDGNTTYYDLTVAGWRVVKDDKILTIITNV